MKTIAMEVKALEKELKELIKEMSLITELTEDDNRYFKNKINNFKHRNKKLQDLIGEYSEDIEYEEVSFRVGDLIG